jgi:hypothetical protein
MRKEAFSIAPITLHFNPFHPITVKHGSFKSGENCSQKRRSADPTEKAPPLEDPYRRVSASWGRYLPSAGQGAAKKAKFSLRSFPSPPHSTERRTNLSSKFWAEMDKTETGLDFPGKITEATRLDELHFLP